jgi:hypothetical protein
LLEGVAGPFAVLNCAASVVQIFRTISSVTLDLLGWARGICYGRSDMGWHRFTGTRRSQRTDTEAD